MTGDANTLELFRTDPDPGVSLEFRRAHEKMECRLHESEDQAVEDASLT